MHVVKRAIRQLAANLGYEISRRHVKRVGVSPFSDMQQFVPAGVRPMIMDVGANIGQSAKRFRDRFPSSLIHSFEPSSETFQELSKNVSDDKGVTLWNCALGASVGKQVFRENTLSAMSSFLELSTAGIGQVHKESVVSVTTVDQFLETNQIRQVDILKVDTQGYELEVFKGAEKSMNNNQIGLLYFELIFSQMYSQLPSVDQVMRYLFDHNFTLVSIYEWQYQYRLASHADALFINKDYYARTQKPGDR